MAGIDWINKNVAYISNAIDNQELLTENIEPIDKYRKVRVYPFRIVSGTQLLTKAGEVDILTNINKEGQYANFYTGNDQITIVWEGSTTLSANNPSTSNQILETLQVGRYIDLLASDEGLLNKANNISSVNLYGIDYTTTETQNAITLFCDCSEDEYETNKVWSYIEIDKDRKFIASSYVPTDYDIQNYVYLILDPRYQSYQWLRIKNVVYSYNNANRKPISALIEFETINNDFTNTGKSILQYFHNGTPNESYAFPKETYDEEGNAITTLDETHIQTSTNSFEGVDSIQIDYLGAYALSSIGILGRVVGENNFERNGEIYTRQVQTPQILLLNKSERIVESPFINRLPVQNVFAAYDMYNDVRGVWNSYKDSFGAQNSLVGYNVTATKQVITGMRPKSYDWNNVLNTNKVQGDETSSHYPYTNWFTFGMINDYWIQPINQSDYLRGVPNVVGGSNQKAISIPQFLNQNYFINFGIDELTTNYTQSTKYKLSDVLGIFGNIFNTLVGGLDMGWITNKTLATGQTYNILLPTEVVENQQAIGNLTKDYALPLDYFNDQLATKMLPVNSNLYTAYRFTLTHLFKYTGANVNTNRSSYMKLGGGKNGIWDTKYLGQSRDEDGNLLLIDGSEFTPDIYQIEPYETTNSYLIDWMQTKGIGICDRRISMYRNVYNEFLQAYSNESVYQLIAQTKSKVKNNITLWSDEIKFNYYDEFNTFGQINWPVQHNPKSPNVNVEENKIIQLPQSEIWTKQVTWGEGQQSSKQSTFGSIMNSCYPSLTAKSNFDFEAQGNDSRGWNQMLGYYTDTPDNWKQKEKKFQSYFRIDNFKTQINNIRDNENKVTDSTWIQTYDIKDLSFNFAQTKWAPNDSLSNARTNLQQLDLNIAINTNPVKVNDGNDNYKVVVNLKDNDLISFLRGEQITKQIEVTWNGEAPNTLLYPITIFGDYVSGARRYQKPIPGVASGNFNVMFENGSWVWLTNLNRLFDGQIYTMNTNYLSNYNNFVNKWSSEFVRADEGAGLNPNKIGINEYTINYKDNNYNINVPNNDWNQLFGYDTQTRRRNNYSVFVNNGSKTKSMQGLLQNYKPYVIEPTRKTILSFNVALQIKSDSSLDIAITNIKANIQCNGKFSISDIRNKFNARVLPRTDYSSQYTEYAITPKLQDIDNVEYTGKYANLLKAQIIKNPTSYSQTTNWSFKYQNQTTTGKSSAVNGVSFFYNTEMDGSLYQVAKSGSNNSGTLMNSAISPSFFWDTYVGIAWRVWKNYPNTQTGNKSGTSNLVQELNEAVNDSGDMIIVNSGTTQQDLNWTINMQYPITAGSMRSGQRFWMLEDINGYTQSYSLKFQYDPNLNFQPVLALSFTPTWKN